MSLRSAFGYLLCYAAVALSQSPVPLFKANSNLQSIAVEVVDKQDRGVRGLTAEDFTLLENGRPQKIAFFGAQDQPIRLTILLDSSGSMKSSEKLKRARELLRPLLRGNVRGDVISLVPFTSQIGSFVPLTIEQRLDPPPVQLSSMEGGTALYDAIAASVCQMRGQNMRQAIVAITDGGDQNSRLRVEQLIALLRSSRPQVFVIGFMERGESDEYRERGDNVKLVSGHEVDNPLWAFQRISRESGAESFFPSSERQLERVLDRILAILRAQYMLAYYPADVEKLRKIQVKVRRSGVTVKAPRTVAAQKDDFEAVHFEAGSCLVSPKEHPYPWEQHVAITPTGANAYRDNFADRKSGWPNHGGAHYVSGGYELSGAGDAQVMGEVKVAAYGPWWHDFRASISIDEEKSNAEAEGFVFRLNDTGYYAVLLQNARDMEGYKGEYFKVIKQRWFDRERVIVFWTRIQPDLRPNKERMITVECKGRQITIDFDGWQAAAIKDDTFADGYVGMTKIGVGRAVFRDLQETLPPPNGLRYTSGRP